MSTKQTKQFKKVFRGYDPKAVDSYISIAAEREESTRRAQRERIEELLEENYNIRERLAELQRAQNDVADALITAQAVAKDIEQNAKDYADKALIEAKKFYATWQAYSKTIVASFTEDELAAFCALEAKIGEVIAGYERRLKGEPKEKEQQPDFSQEADGELGKDNAEQRQSSTATQASQSLADEQSEDNGGNERASGSDEQAAQQPSANVQDDGGDGIEPRKNTRSMSAADFVKTIERAADDLNTEAEKSAKASSKSPANPIAKVEQAAGQTIDLRELLKPEESLEEICASLGLIDDPDGV